MKETRILLFEQGTASETAVGLKEAIVAELNEGLTLQHQREAGSDCSLAAKALAGALDRCSPDLLLLIAPSDPEWLQALLATARVHTAHPAVVAVVTEPDNPAILHHILELGASDFLVPPLRQFEIWPRLKRLLQFREEQGDGPNQRRIFGVHQLVGESPVLLEEVNKVPRFAQSDASILITGETGTGKEVCARSIHYLSGRAKFPFVPLNCGAVPSELVENELFGHTAGAYTTAQSTTRGLIQEADRGTLFLDEIDSMPLMAQVKLLRFLQEKEYRPLGSTRTSKADVRVIAASNSSLEVAMREGRLRQDLFYRLNVLRLHLPPLRDRREDIPLLAAHFLARHGGPDPRRLPEFAPASLQKLIFYDWPGNVRELENVVQRALVLAKGDMIQPESIELPGSIARNGADFESFNQKKARVVTDFERRYLQEMLLEHQGNIGRAARAARKNRRVFFELMRKHNIRVERTTRRRGREADFVLVMGENVHPEKALMESECKDF